MLVVAYDLTFVWYRRANEMKESNKSTICIEFVVVSTFE